MGGRTIQEWPRGAAPRERMASGLPSSLATHELLAVLVGSGSAGRSAVEVAAALLRRFDGSLRRMAAAEPCELRAVPGIGPARASSVVAAFELGRRLASESGRRSPRIRGPRDVQARLGPRLRDRRQEEFWALYLDTQNRILVERRVTVGLLNASLVHPREVFAPAIAHTAASVLLAHNHPSGDPEPSAEDLEVTRQLAASGALLGIPVRDHVVLGDGAYVSLRERGWVETTRPAAAAAARSTPRGAGGTARPRSGPPSGPPGAGRDDR